MKNLLFIGIIFLFASQSCKLEKKLYSRGFHCEWKNKEKSRKLSSNISSLESNITKVDITQFTEINTNEMVEIENQINKTDDSLVLKFEKEIKIAIKGQKIIITQFPKQQFRLINASYNENSKLLKGKLVKLEDSLRVNTVYYKDTMLLLDLKRSKLSQNENVEIDLNKVKSIPIDLKNNNNKNNLGKIYIDTESTLFLISFCLFFVEIYAFSIGAFIIGFALMATVFVLSMIGIGINDNFPIGLNVFFCIASVLGVAFSALYYALN